MFINKKCLTCRWCSFDNSIECLTCDNSNYLRSDHKGCVADCLTINEHAFTGGVYKC